MSCLNCSDLRVQLKYRTCCLDKVIVAKELLERQLAELSKENEELRRNLAKTHLLVVRCGYCGEEICRPELYTRERGLTKSCANTGKTVGGIDGLRKVLAGCNSARDV